MSAFDTLGRFFREQIATRPALVGGGVALALGIAAGSALGIGKGFEEPPPMQPVTKRLVELAPAPIVPMVDASGKTPEWVIGTDNIPGRETWRDRLPVATVTDPEDEAEAPRRRGLGWLLTPWRWGRGEDREAPPPRPSRRLESDRDADRRAERAQDRYADVEREPAPVERERRRPRYEPDYRGRYTPRTAPQYEPRNEESEEAPYPFEQAPPPPERWRYGR